nr:NAD(P)-dependent oxidoreductase [Candidatus Gracilibacteria bacterium]
MKIAFFEVESRDYPLIQSRYPQALIFSEGFHSKLINQVKDCEILCGMVHSDFNAENLKQIPSLKLIITRSVGYDHIDLKWAADHQIPVCHVPDYGSHVIAEHVFALLLSSVRYVLEGEERTNQNQFDWQGLRGISLKGKTLAVLGTGKIGQHVCRIASQGFLMKVIA